MKEWAKGKAFSMPNGAGFFDLFCCRQIPQDVQFISSRRQQSVTRIHVITMASFDADAFTDRYKRLTDSWNVRLLCSFAFPAADT